MRAIKRSVLVVVVLGVCAASAAALEIPPGAYQLEWKIPEESSESFAGDRERPLRLLSVREAAKVSGLASTKAMWACEGRFTLFLDESKGTGKGYDNLYLVPGVQVGKEVDLKKAVKVALKDYGTVLAPDTLDDVMVDLTIGPPGSQVTKQAVLDVEIPLAKAKNGVKTPQRAIIEIRGGWSGKIRTDLGYVKVETVDENGNAVYNDKPGPGAFGDRITITERSRGVESYESYPEAVGTGRPVQFREKLYVFNVSALGDKVEVQPYGGDVGRIKVEARDGYKRPAICESVNIYTRSGESFSMGSGPPLPGFPTPADENAGSLSTKSAAITVPVGRYDRLSAWTYPATKSSSARSLESAILIHSERPIVVKKDATTIVKLGGPAKMVIEPGNKVITLKRGQAKEIPISISAGGDTVISPGWEGPVVKVVNSRGRALITTKAKFG